MKYDGIVRVFARLLIWVVNKPLCNSFQFRERRTDDSKIIAATLIVLLNLMPFSPVLAATPPQPSLKNPDIFTDAAQPRINGSTGAFTQSVPLDIPPGRNGLQPDITLDYNSQRTQDSIVGYGWQLSIPYIQRLNKTGSQDLYGSTPYFTSSLDGELANMSISTTTVASTTLTNNLTGYWKFDEFKRERFRCHEQFLHPHQ